MAWQETTTVTLLALCRRPLLDVTKDLDQLHYLSFPEHARHAERIEVGERGFIEQPRIRDEVRASQAYVRRARDCPSPTPIRFRGSCIRFCQL